MAQTNLEDFSLSLVKEDSISLLSIKPVKHPKKLLKQVIAQFQEDRMQYKEGTYQIDAIFLRDSLAPLSVRCTIPAKAGITFEKGKLRVGGNHTLNEYYILAPWTYQVPIGTLLPNIKLRVHLAEPLYPLKQYNTTVTYYDISAYHVADASGRGVYRFVFDRNRETRLFKYDGRKYDVGEVTGVTYFDSQTLHITKFKGRARLISDQHIVLIRYNIDYDTDDGNPVLRRIKIAWEAGGTSINATVRRL